MYKCNPTCQVIDLNLIYQEYFGDKKGYFIDVGAFDGYNFSNTDILADAGWSGILFEPTTEFFARLVKFYAGNNNVILHKVAVGDYIGVATIYTGQHACSTIDDDFKRIIENTDWGKEFYKEKEICKVRTLDSLLEGFHINPGQVDVLSIDVEGYELHVLRGFDIDKWKPRMVIIEAHETYQGGDRPVLYPKINEYFSTHNYKKIYCDSINNIYIRP